MKTLRALFLMVALVTCNSLKAQTILSMDTSALITFPLDTHIHLGDSVFVPLQLTNLGSSAISGDTLEFYYQIGGDSTPVYVDDNAVSGISCLFDTFYQPSHDFDTSARISRTLRFNFSPPRFSVGTNWITIWPVLLHAQGTVVTDTFYGYVNILNPATSINEPGYENLKVFMYEQQLIITDDCNEIPAQLKVYNDLGAMILEKQLSGSATIPMNKYSPGIYFAEVTFRDNSRRVFKVFNSRFYN